MQAARAAAMPCLDALARASRQKIISKLVEKGVLEADMLMDEVDDFEITDTATRPGTSSGGIRPPTASGSSTKHRPALANPSLSAASSTPLSQAHAPVLPYGTALTEDQKLTHAPLIQVLGEDLVRCLLDKAWAQREAAVREVERLVVCSASGKLTGDKALAKTAETLQVLSEVVELGLNDTVARVFQCTLRLCQVVAVEFVPAMGADVSRLDGFLERTASAALVKLGDTKQRLRSDCVTLLHSLASLQHIGQARLCRILTTQFRKLTESSSVVSSSPLVAAELFSLFKTLIRDGFSASSSSNHVMHRPELQPILDLLLPAFENKHVDIRNAAIEAYIAVYEVTNGGTDGGQTLDLQGFLAQVKPAIRETIAKKVVQIARNMPNASSAEDERPEKHSADSARQQPLALDINKLKHLCSDEITKLLTSSLAAHRCSGVDQLMKMLCDSPRNARFKGAWEICCLLSKQLLLEGTPALCLAAFHLLRLLVDPPTPSPEYAIPWGEWGVHLILGSTVRSIIQQSASTSVRVRLEVAVLLQQIAKKSAIGKNAVCNALLSAPEQRDLAQMPQKQQRKVALCRLRWQILLRLQLIYELLTEAQDTSSTQHAGQPSLARRKSSSSGATRSSGDNLSVENVIPFLGSCAIHPSPLVRSASRRILTHLKTTAPELVQRFIHEECSPSLQRRIQPLLTDDDDEENNHADHFGAEDTTVVRGSRASHIRRVAALRPPRSVPVEEKSMEVDVFPPPHSAPGRSRRSLHQAEDESSDCDYVAKPREERDGERRRAGKDSTTNQAQQPIWLDQAPRKKSSSSMALGDSGAIRFDNGESPELGAAVGGGAANLVKMRRRSSVRSQNNEDADDSAPSAHSRTSQSHLHRAY
ncbi:hypothetical protein PINS_up005087 [Pythium insidiosum]|nr:hypothetical protein PINS_up005087 [Pythium insidiosum]